MTDDPRIVPSGGEQVIISGVCNCSRSTYHTTNCYQRKRMKREKEVSKDVAEWKGLVECQACQNNK